MVQTSENRGSDHLASGDDVAVGDAGGDRLRGYHTVPSGRGFLTTDKTPPPANSDDTSMVGKLGAVLLVCVLAAPLPGCSLALIKGGDATSPEQPPDCGARVGGAAVEGEIIGTDLGLGIFSLLLGAVLVSDPDLCFAPNCDPDPDSNLPTVGAVSLGVGALAVTSFVVGKRRKRRCDAARERHSEWTRTHTTGAAP